MQELRWRRPLLKHAKVALGLNFKDLLQLPFSIGSRGRCFQQGTLQFLGLGRSSLFGN